MRLTTIPVTAFAVAFMLFSAVVTTAPVALASTTSPEQVSYVVLPHPDDEWQAWALIEGSSSNYKVFITLTNGEETRYCDTPYVGAWPAPNPTPAGKWSQSCADARLNSWTGYLTGMSATDPAIPGDFTYLGVKGPFPSNGVTLNTVDNGVTVASDRTARVWLDRQGMGAAIAFDLGDGDLTADEVKWALETVQSNRAVLGINTTLPDYNVLGSFRNSTNPNCAIYNHSDHTAVHVALWNDDFGVAYRAAATCATDPDASRTKVVTSESASASWASDSKAFQQSYGWLGQYTLSPSQGYVFMQTQSFWQRY